MSAGSSPVTSATACGLEAGHLVWDQVIRRFESCHADRKQHNKEVRNQGEGVFEVVEDTAALSGSYARRRCSEDRDQSADGVGVGARALVP